MGESDHVLNTARGIVCEDYRRLLDDFAAAIHELVQLHQQQLRAIMEGDTEGNRFDLLIHMANAKKQDAKYGIVNLSYSERVWADWRREFEIVRPPLLFARLRRTETSRVGDESISANVAQCKIDFGRHRGAIESAELVGVI